MADNILIKDANNANVTAATDELAGAVHSPKVSILDGSGSATAISPATSGNQTTTLTRLGDLTEAAPGTDTASSGMNGRLQRIAQRITSLIALLPSSLGGKTAANSLAVTTATDDPMVTRTGEVQVSPTANTVLDRLKTISTNLTTLLPASLGGKAASASLAVTTATDDPMVLRMGEVQATPTANTMLSRLKLIYDELVNQSAASGTAGSPSTDVLTVQGITSMTPLTVDGGRVRRVTLVPSLDTTAVASGDVLAATEVFAAVVRANDAWGVCRRVTISDAIDTKKALTLVFFKANISMGAENAVASIAGADADDILDWVSVTAGDYKDFGSGAVAKKSVEFVVQPGSGTDDIWMGIIADEAVDYTAATDLTVALDIYQD